MYIIVFLGFISLALYSYDAVNTAIGETKNRAKKEGRGFFQITNSKVDISKAKNKREQEDVKIKLEEERKKDKKEENEKKEKKVCICGVFNLFFSIGSNI